MQNHKPPYYIYGFRDKEGGGWVQNFSNEMFLRQKNNKIKGVTNGLERKEKLHDGLNHFLKIDVDFIVFNIF